jgi:hypothetical protein
MIDSPSIHSNTSSEIHLKPTEMHTAAVLFSPGSPAAFPIWFKASGFASHPLGWFAFSSFPQYSPAFLEPR